MATDVARLALQIDVKGAQRAKAALAGLQSGSIKATRATDQLIAANTRLNATAGASRSAFRLQKGALQQAGFQIQDFAVQVGAGQSALVAFSQQGSQLAGILGPGGAVIGAVIAVGAAIAGPFIARMGMGTDAVTLLTETLDEVDESLERAENGTLALTERIREMAQVSQAAARIELNSQLVKIDNALKGVSSSLRDTFGENGDFSSAISIFDQLSRAGETTGSVMTSLENSLQGVNPNLVDDYRFLTNSLTGLRKEFGLTNNQSLLFLDALKGIQDDPTADNLNLLIGRLNSIQESSQATTPEFALMASEVSNVATKALRLIEQGESLDGVLEDLTGSLTVVGDEAQSAGDQLQELVSGFQEQADTLGMNSRQLALYQVERLAANGADAESVELARKQIKASFDKIDAYKREEERLKILRQQYKVNAKDDPLLQRIAAQGRGQNIIKDDASTAAKEYEKQFSSASDRVASSLQDAIASGDWQGLGQQVGGTIAGEIGGAVSTGLSSALESSLGAAAGPLGAVGGAVVGGIIGGILGGKTTTVSKQLNFAIQNAMVSGFEQVTINTERFLGTSTKIISEELSVAITGAVQNSFDMTARDIGSTLRSIGLDYQNAVDDFSFTLEDTNPADFVGEAANEFLRESTVVAEVYQRAGETMVDAIARIADDFEIATQAFTAADVDISQFVENLSAEIGDTFADNLEQIQQRISAKQAEIAGRELQLTETGGGPTGAAAETRIKGQLRTLNRELDNLLERQAEQSDRLAEAANIAAVGLRENLIAAVAELSNISTDQALSNLSGLTSSLESLRFSEPEILQRQIDAARESLEQFADIGIDASAPLADIIQQLRDFGPQTAEDTAALLVAAGHVDSLKTATEGLAQAAEDAFVDLTSSTDEALNRLRASIREERERATDAYSAEQDAIRAATDARLEANKLATDAAKEGLSAIRSEVSDIESALDQLRGAFDPMQEMRRESALDLLRNALATGDLTGTGEAAGIAGQIEAAGFATRADFEREQGRTLNLLSDLEDTGETQLTTAERSLRELEAQTQTIKASGDAQLSALEQMHDAEMARLDRTLEDAQSQIELLRGIDNSVLSVADAINNLAGALGQETASRVESAYMGAGRTADEQGADYWEAQIRKGAASIADLEFALWLESEGAREFARAQGLSFAGGGIANGPSSGYMAEMHGQEAVVPIPNGSIPVRLSGGGNADLLAEMKKMREELNAANRALVKSNEKQRELLQRWDQNGLPEVRAFV